ncbi:MAG: carbohydrate ABC transporter substrate-binding protein [Spirochaetaceae bacterium]|nr:MAG: carbohydrate ABC transporter substrate-binding protein [Spirochaetaceae bacterium]
MLLKRFRKNRRTDRFRPFVLAVLFVTILAGCADEPVSRVRIWTDMPEMLDYAILFNQQQDTFTVEVESRRQLLSTLQDSDATPDLVIGRHLNQAAAEELFAEIGSVVAASGGPQQFYPGFLAMGRFGNVQRLLPVSFDLPAVVFTDAITPDPEFRLYLELDDIRDAAAAFNEPGSAGTGRMGYSPLWDDDFTRVLADAYRVAFRQGPGGGILWSSEPLRDALSFAGEWVVELNEGPERSDDFHRRYLTRPRVDLVNDGRIGFAFTTGQDFFGSSNAERPNLNLRWVARDGVISVPDSLVMAGIPERALNSAGARAFIRWLLNRETQHELLEAAAVSDHGSPGIAGGFSSIVRVNERDLLELHPYMLGRIPPASTLRWPARYPQMWPRMRDEAVIPWMQEQIRLGEYTGSPENRIQTWLRQQERPSSRN